MDATERLAQALRRTGLTIAVAESCTGGLLAVRLTDLAGASEYFRGGVVVYQNDVKIDLLDVPQPVLEAHGAVSEETVRVMASGCRRLFSSDIGVAVTGVAGPGGGTREKPVGLVYIGIETPRSSECREYRWPGDRASNRARSVDAAIASLVALTEAWPGSVENGRVLG